MALSRLKEDLEKEKKHICKMNKAFRKSDIWIF